MRGCAAANLNYFVESQEFSSSKAAMTESKTLLTLLNLAAQLKNHLATL